MVIVVGSGAGGSTVAKEISEYGLPVTIVEKGLLVEPRDVFNYYAEISDDLDLLYTTCVGGCTPVAAGNMVPSLQSELREYNINISKEIMAIKAELGIHQLSDSHMGEGTLKFMDACKGLGLSALRMPKVIDEDKCVPCGKCALGCPQDAKWTGIDYVNIAVENGAELLTGKEAVELVVDSGEVKGVLVKDLATGELEIIEDDVVVLAAGALSNSDLLQKIGISAGEQFFMDTFITIGGVLNGIRFNSEVQMNALVKRDNFILAPHYSGLLLDDLKERYPDISAGDIFSIMVKISDDNTGRVSGGEVVKDNTLADVKSLVEGAGLASVILEEMGVDVKSIVSTRPRGAHAGGTAAIGSVVDENLETSVKGLFVGDASVLPVGPGLPPILTIMALAKRLGKHIIMEN